MSGLQFLLDNGQIVILKKEGCCVCLWCVYSASRLHRFYWCTVKGLGLLSGEAHKVAIYRPMDTIHACDHSLNMMAVPGERMPD